MGKCLSTGVKPGGEVAMSQRLQTEDRGLTTGSRMPGSRLRGSPIRPPDIRAGERRAINGVGREFHCEKGR